MKKFRHLSNQHKNQKMDNLKNNNLDQQQEKNLKLSNSNLKNQINYQLHR